MKIIVFILLLSSLSEATQTIIPTTCYARRETILIATTVSVLVASSLSDTNCWILQNKDGSNSIFGSINASNNTQGFEVQPGSIYQLYIGPFNTLYLRSSTGSINADLISGSTTY